jgi:Tfp pilus assembly protein PilP
LKHKVILASLLLLPLAACGGNGDDKLAERVEDAADNRATAMEAQADALDARAEQVRDTGERRADAIDAADYNAQAMSEARKDAIIANEAAAVR